MFKKNFWIQQNLGRTRNWEGTALRGLSLPQFEKPFTISQTAKF